MVKGDRDYRNYRYYRNYSDYGKYGRMGARDCNYITLYSLLITLYPLLFVFLLLPPS
jgi:hypothetical protein